MAVAVSGAAQAPPFLSATLAAAMSLPAARPAEPHSCPQRERAQELPCGKAQLGEGSALREAGGGLAAPRLSSK